MTPRLTVTSGLLPFLLQVRVRINLKLATGMVCLFVTLSLSLFLFLSKEIQKYHVVSPNQHKTPSPIVFVSPNDALVMPLYFENIYTLSTNATLSI